MKDKKDKIMKHEFILTKLIRVQDKKDTTWDAYHEILSYLDENTEGVSDATHKSGVLHDVGEIHASGEGCKSDLASGELPLEKITDDGKSFYCYWQEKHGHDRCTTKCAMCTRKAKRLKSS